ncbi:hypothetical protein AHAS_Ahas10G0035200 [Arachis hypogaea]
MFFAVVVLGGELGQWPMVPSQRSAEAVGCKNESVGEHSALEERIRASNGFLRKVRPLRAKSGPKIMPKGVVDGQQVNIPVLPLLVPRDGGG